MGNIRHLYKKLSYLKDLSNYDATIIPVSIKTNNDSYRLIKKINSNFNMSFIINDNIKVFNCPKINMDLLFMSYISSTRQLNELFKIIKNNDYKNILMKKNNNKKINRVLYEYTRGNDVNIDLY